MRKLAKIGVLGHQLDVADGGDVDPATGRLLSIAELQQVLRLARTRALAPDSATPTPPADRWTRIPGVRHADDLDDDPFGWGPDGDSPDAENPGDEPASTRSGRKHHPEPAAATPRPRSAALRVTRKILGLDRRQARPASPAEVPVPQTHPAAVDVPASPTRRPQDADDFEVAAGPRGFAAVFWRWTARVLVVVLLVAGVNQLFIKPLHHTAAGPATAADIDPAVARQIAARYAADYLSYSPGRTGANLPALTADSVATASTSTQLFSGAGYVTADLVQPGQIVTVDATHVLVAEAVRIHLAIPPAGTAAPQPAASTPAASPPDTANNPGPVPDRWTDLGERWLSMTVPVESTPAGLRVSASGGVFTGEPPTVITPIAGSNSDAATAATTAAVAPAFFTGYAASDVSYLIPPGAPVTGLGGAVTFVSLADWTVQTAADTGTGTAATPTAGIGTAAVTWQLAGSTLQITQAYALSLTFTSGRWYTAALGPATTAANQ